MKKGILFAIFLILFFHSSFAQVVIKEKINLGPLTDDFTLIFSKPNYPGKIFWEFDYYNLGLLKTPITPSVAGAFSIECGGFPIHFTSTYMNCQQYGPGIISGFWSANGSTLPAFPVMAALYNGNWECTPYNIPLIYEQFFDGNKVKYNIKNSETGASIGPIWYEPNPCGTNSLCDQPFNPPGLNIFAVPNSYTPGEECDEPEDIPAGVFKGLYWKLRENEEFTIATCQDQMTGNIKFKYATNLSQQVDLPYIIDLCPDKVNSLFPNIHRFDDLQSFINYLPDIPDLDSACAVRQYIIDHKGIDASGNQTGGEILHLGGIWLTKVTLAHEEQHRCDYENSVMIKRETFEDYFNDYSISCSTYQANPEYAVTDAGNRFHGTLSIFSSEAFDDYKSIVDEVMLNGRPEVQSEVELYLIELDNWGQGHFGKKDWKFVVDNCK